MGEHQKAIADLDDALRIKPESVADLDCRGWR